jgi:glutaredoxin
MTQEKIYLFTTDTCPKCPEAKKFCEKNFPEAEIVQVGNLESLVLAEKYNIRSVPTFVVNNGKVWKSLTLTEMKDAKKNNEENLITY